MSKVRRYKESFLKEVNRFDLCNRQPGSPSPSDVGVAQFYEYESKGIVPDDPHPHFTHLVNGKAWWEWTLNEYAKRYLTDEWDGWYLLAQDFIDDEPGFRQLRQRCGEKPISMSEKPDPTPAAPVPDMSWVGPLIAEIKRENGLSPDAPGPVCIRCRKVVQADNAGNWYCDCHDERPKADSTGG